jgi:hypothetical protein
VRLYLALNEAGVEPLEAEARLHLVERQLVLHLLQGGPPTPSAVSKAHFLVQHAQTALLTSSAEVSAILHEWYLLRALQPLRWAAQQAAQAK